MNKRFVIRSLVLAGTLGVFAGFTVAAAPNAAAPADAGVARRAQVLDVERTGVASPVGLAFGPSGSFYVLGSVREAAAEIVTLEPFELRPGSDRAGSARLAATVDDPINIAFDAPRRRLLLLGHADELLEVPTGSDGTLDGSALSRRDAGRLGLREPQGITVDPATGTVFVLDTGPPRIVGVEPGPEGAFDTAVVTEIDLAKDGVSAPRGLAYDSSNGHLLLRDGQSLLELTTSGEVVATRDLTGLDLVTPEGLVLAPSGDQTDDPGELSLWVADAGGGSRRSSGQIVEVSLAAAPAADAPDFTSTVVNTVDLGALAPPSPDPSGLAYLPTSNTLLMVDGEVEETVDGVTHFQGANVWELTLGGSVVRTTNVSDVSPTVFPISNEPVGVAFDPSSGHCYVSDDSQKRVTDLSPGADGQCGTSDDSSTYFDTISSGNADPEGIAFDSWHNRLFVADGVNAEVYQYTLTGGLVGQFDVEQYGVLDPESVEFNAVSGTLFVLSNKQSGPIVIETTTDGALLQTLDVSAAPMVKPAGLAYAPGSSQPGEQHLYVVDRGIDNNSDPSAVDGLMFELTAPPPVTPGNAPPVVDAGPDQGIVLPGHANLDATVDDDGQPAPPALTATWSQVSGPSTVVFGDATAVDTTAAVRIAGTYVVRLTVSDGELTASDQATLTFTGAGNVSFLDQRVTASSDDAEERPGAVMRLGNADLNMMNEDAATTNVAVGLRFNAIAIPQGAAVEYAYVQFEADQPHSDPTTLTIKAHATDDAPTFGSGAKITPRPTTAAAATWTPDPWLSVGEAGLTQRTSNLGAVIQEIVDRPGWASGNSLALIITGSGWRVAEAWDSNPDAAPLLHVEWSTGGAGNNPPVITSDGGGVSAALSVPENQTAVTDVDATDADSDPLTYSISGGADQALFSVDASTGELTFVSAPNFEAPADQGANNVYDVTVQVADGNGGTDTQAIAVTVTNVNEFPPVITSDGGGASAALSRPENQTAVTTVTATDADTTTPTYSISGGADQAAFAISASTGALTFVSAPDWENPTDVGADNVYDVVVEASDGSFSDSQAIAVTVTDVAEAAAQLYFSVGTAQTLGGISVTPQDIIAFDGTGFSLYLDGSGVGLDAASEVIDAFDILADGRVLVSTTGNVSVPGLSGKDEDVLELTPTSQGPVTSGNWAMYFDGSAFGLSSSGEDVDAVELLPNGHLLISTRGAVSVTGVTGEDKDVLEFTPGANSWTMYFDGSDVGLTTSGEDVDGFALSGGNVYLSAAGNFSVTGVSGADEDVFVFTPTQTGSDTQGSFSSTLYFDGSAYGLAANDLFAIDIP
jgi:uncharacterized protein YjiK